MLEKFKLNYELKIVEIIKGGFIGKSEEFRKNSKIQDNYCFDKNPFNKDDEVEIKIETVDKEEIKEDRISKKSVIFYCIVNEVSLNGFYTKKYKEEENLFKRVFFEEIRGFVTLPDEKMNRFEMGDILRIEVSK